jgi:ferredoxin-NADP reductase/MOSC domain-containing protein YiiM
MTGRLVSVNVGRPRDVRWRNRVIRTSIWKASVPDRRWVGRLNVAGDEQADLVGHGGEHRAVYVYDLSAYRHWERELGRTDFVLGQFGENFTVEGLPDEQVCIGDRFRIGEALFEVTQPRVTCHKLGVRMVEPRMPALLYAHGLPGFYLRVLEEGEVGAGDRVERIAAGPGTMTVREVSALLYLPGHPADRLRRAAGIPALSEGWRRSFSAMLETVADSTAGIRGLGPPSSGPPAWAGLRTFRVAAITHETRAIVSLELEPEDGEPLPPFRPGQFLTLSVPLATGPELRSYSLSAAPNPRRYRISAKREPGGMVSAHLHDELRAGDTVEIGAPRGIFTLDSTGAGPLVLVSAGVGATPLVSMLESLSVARSEREIWWIHGARSGAEHAFADEVARHLAALPCARSHIRYSRPSTADRLRHDHDAEGRISVETLRGLAMPPAAEYFLCGPATWMRELAAGLTAWGVSDDRIHVERFGPAATPPGTAPHPPPGAQGTGPSVVFARSGLTVRWDASFGSLLDLAEACDVPVAWSCRTGACHSCEVGRIDGESVYEPEPLEPPEEGRVLLCCSRPNSDLVLEA